MRFSLHTDWWTKFYVIFTGLLVFIGGLGVCAALRSLWAIERQADLMEGGLYVDTPRVIDFEDGKAPVVFVNIINSGMIAARNVSIRINIELANHTTQYVHDQVMTIPAHNAGRECSLRHGKALAIGELLKVQRGELGFRISGHATSQKEKIDYCYKYTPWAFENRPKDLPDFVACDFDTRTAMSGTARPTGFSLTVSMGGPTTARGEISDTSASKEPSDPS